MNLKKKKIIFCFKLILAISYQNLDSENLGEYETNLEIEQSELLLVCSQNLHALVIIYKP